jgi:unspecific monooxygenase
MLLAVSIVASLLVGVWVVRKFGVPFILPPARFPKNIPTIPFYYALLPLFKSVDQEVLWHKHLKEPLTRHGAVKIYFGGSWNVLVTRPAYIDQVLKHHDAFPKAGNQVKNPHGLLAFYTGENIISTIGDTWKRFTSIIRPGLQADVDNQIIINNAQKLVGVLLREQYSNGRVVMPSPLQQYTLENLGQALLGVNFDVSYLDYLRATTCLQLDTGLNIAVSR